MSMRFTDTNKWRDPWFLELPVLLKLLWIYLCDSCDNAGVWTVNRRHAEFEVGDAIEWDVALKAFDGRIVEIAGGRKWHLTKFIGFQHPGGLNEVNAAHRQILRLLTSHGLTNQKKEGASEGASQAPLMKPKQRHSIDKDRGVQGGAPSALRTADLLAEFALSASNRAAIEWSAGLNQVARCKSLDEARAFLRWAIAVCAKADVRVEYWRHVALLAQEWANGMRDQIFKGEAT